MSMMREEARIELQAMKDTFEEYEPGESRCQMALNVALSALRPVSREQVEQMRSRWVPLNNTQEHFCESCGVAFNLYAYCKNDYQFCPACGAPMTDEAVEMVMESLEALKDVKGD